MASETAPTLLQVLVLVLLPGLVLPVSVLGLELLLVQTQAVWPAAADSRVPRRIVAAIAQRPWQATESLAAATPAMSQR